MTSRIDRYCDTVLFVITPESVKTVDMVHQGGVTFEMQLANARRLRDKTFKIIGIYREGNENTAYLRDHRYIDFRDGTKYKQKLRNLAEFTADGKIQTHPTLISDRSRKQNRQAPKQPF